MKLRVPLKNRGMSLKSRPHYHEYQFLTSHAAN